MKTASSSMKAHLQGDCTTLARLYKITRQDGTIFTFTDHDKDISTKGFEAYFTDDDPSTGGWVYEAAVGGFVPSATENKSDLTVDNQEVTAIIDSSTIKETDIRYGVWDSASVEIRLCNWADLTQGEIRMRKGVMGKMSMKSGVLTAEVLGLTNLLQVLQGRTFGPDCDAELGDARCTATVPSESGTINTSPSIGQNDAHHLTPNSGLTGAGGTWGNLTTGTFVVKNTSAVTNSGQSGVGSISSPSTTVAITDAVYDGSAYATYTFSVTSGAIPAVGKTIAISGMTSSGNNGSFVIITVQATNNATWSGGYYDDGILTFTSGPNAGLSYQIGIWDGITLSTKNAIFVPPNNGDAFTISPGCRHNMTDCRVKFNNLVNYRGFPSIPGQDSIMMYPDATS